jgi:hypothetical protein
VLLVVLWAVTGRHCAWGTVGYGACSDRLTCLLCWVLCWASVEASVECESG